jgi:predicted choloylglycine hydrolase
MTSLCFRAVQEDRPGPQLAALFRQHWPGYRAWFLQEGEEARPSYAVGARMLRRHMPELVPTWERLVELAGGGDLAARFLTLWQPPAFVSGCTQAIWLRDQPALIRNYDYPPGSCEGLLLRSRFTGTAVLAMADCLWGVLDGINEHGLCISLAFGGRHRVGAGFGIALVLRYILETCRTAHEALDVLRRVPVHLPYNLAILDRGGGWQTVAIAPDRQLEIRREPYSANRQGTHVWPDDHRIADTVRREALLEAYLDNPAETLERLLERFVRPPIYRPIQPEGWGTLYTACYFPARGGMMLRWPYLTWHQSLADFREGERLVWYR